MEFEKRSGIRKYLDFTKENFILMFKHIIEYKANLFFMLLEHVIFISTLLFFYFVLISNFNDIIGWEFKDFFLFLILTEITMIIAGLFSWKEWLFHFITRGHLNSYLTKPVNTMYAFFLGEISYHAFLYLIFDLIIYSSILIYLKFELYNLALSFFIFILIILFIIFQIEFIRSFDFLVNNISWQIWQPFGNFYDLTRQYPYVFFSNLSIRYVLFIIPFVFISSLLVPLLRGREVDYIDLQLLILVIMVLLLIISTIAMWRYGLKKYEAFG